MQTGDAEGPTPQLWEMRGRATADGGGPLCRCHITPYTTHSESNYSSKWVIIVVSNAIRRHKASIVTPPEQLILLAKNIKPVPALTRKKRIEDSSNVRDLVSFLTLDVILLHECLDVLLDVGDFWREPGLDLLNHFLHELHVLHLLARLHDTDNRRLLKLANIPFQKEEREELT